MFGADYRVILRRFEFERLMVHPPLDRVYFGGRYSDRLLENFYATDASRLHRTLGRLNEAQRTLYSLNAFCGEVSNGGISQFFFNSQPVLVDAVASALKRIGAEEALREYSAMVSRVRHHQGLAAIRASATGWDDYLAFKEGLGGGRSTEKSFDEWFFAGQAEVLDLLMRAFLAGREDEFVRFCDGLPRLEARWTRKRLDGVAASYDWYNKTTGLSRPYPFFDLLFDPGVREQLGCSREERQESARVIAEELMPCLRQAARKTKIVTYEASPKPRLTIPRRSRDNEGGLVIISFCENELDLEWMISAW